MHLSSKRNGWMDGWMDGWISLPSTPIFPSISCFTKKILLALQRLGEQACLLCFCCYFGHQSHQALVVCCVQGACSVSCFCSQHPVCAPGSSEVAVGWGFLLLLFLSFCILWPRICPNCAFVQLFLVPYSFFVFCC